MICEVGVILNAWKLCYVLILYLELNREKMIEYEFSLFLFFGLFELHATAMLVSLVAPHVVYNPHSLFISLFYRPLIMSDHFPNPNWVDGVTPVI